MKSIKLLTAILALSLAAGSAQGQGFLGKIRNAVSNVVPQSEQPAVKPATMTPQAVVANAPGLPSPQEWVANGGQTEAFKAKINELHDQLQRMSFQGGQTQVTQADIDKEMKRQEQQIAQSDKQMQQMFGMNIDQMANMSEAEIEAKVMPRAQQMQGQSMAQAQKYVQVLASLGITEADMEKMDNMDDKQAEAYIQQRLKQNGYTGADLQQRLIEAGIRPMSDAELAASERDSRKVQAQAETLDAAAKNLTEFMDQKVVTEKKIEEALMSVNQRLDALLIAHQPKIAATNPNAIGWEDVMMGGVTEQQYNSMVKARSAAIADYQAAVYHAWLDYIGTVQGHLKFLMPYAQAADDAAKAQMSVASARMGASTGQQGAGMHAITVAGQYFSITASEPDADHKREIK